jgi:predicted metal-dependent hydrolase
MLLEVEGLIVQLRRKRVKRLNLRIHPTGDVVMSIPLILPIDIAYGFVREKRQWIEEHRKRLQTKARELPNTLVAGERINFLGERYELILHETWLAPNIEIQGDAIHFFIQPSLTTKQKQGLLSQWYHSQMQQRLPDLFQKWEAKMGVKSQFVGIKMMKTRWGSCQPAKQRIWLNLRLIEKPLICLEYVIVHELVHILEPSHNRRFYELMSRYFPAWKQAKLLLESTACAAPVI